MYFLNLILTSIGKLIVGFIFLFMFLLVAALIGSTVFALIGLFITAIFLAFDRVCKRWPNISLAFTGSKLWFLGSLTACAMFFCGLFYGLMQLRLH